MGKNIYYKLIAYTDPTKCNNLNYQYGAFLIFDPTNIRSEVEWFKGR